MKLNKTKKYTILGVALATVAVSSVGLATWLTGLTQKSVSADVSVDIDVVKDSTQYVSIALDEGENGLTFCESAEISLDQGRVIGFDHDDDNPKTQDLTINLKEFNFVYSNDSFEFSKLTLKLTIDNELEAAGNAKWPTYTRKAGNALGLIAKEYSYIDLVGGKAFSDGSGYGLEITSSNIDTYFETETEYKGGSAYTFKKFKQNALIFKRGTLFGDGSQTPSEFYNSKIPATDTTVQKVNKLEQVKTELAEMNKAFAGKTMKIEVSLVLNPKPSASN